MITAEIKNKIETELKDKITSLSPIAGGCISESFAIQTSKSKKLFIKINQYTPRDMFSKEANGLREIQKSQTIRVPVVILASNDFILMEFIDSRSKAKNFFEDFGQRFAEMHKYKSEYFGFYEDNYIGSTIQINTASEEEKSDWTKFYFNKRLLFQFKLAEKNGYVDSSFRTAFKKLEDKIETILDGQNEKPSLLHGDLWSGNYIVDENGKACLIDPACYYGNREADLAMTKLFGGFSNSFYLTYNQTYPLEDGYNFRENIYKLYHILNHLNLFGGAYYHQAISLMKYYL